MLELDFCVKYELKNDPMLIENLQARKVSYLAMDHNQDYQPQMNGNDFEMNMEVSKSFEMGEVVRKNESR